MKREPEKYAMTTKKRDGIDKINTIHCAQNKSSIQITHYSYYIEVHPK